MGFDHNVCLTFVSCSDQVDSHYSQESQRRPVTVKHFQRLLGLMAAASNVIPFGLLYMRPLQWWLKTKGFSPRGNDQGNTSNGHIPDRLGSLHDWPPCPRSVEWSSCHLSHQLPGDAGRVSSTQTLFSGLKKSPCVGTPRQHSSGFLYKPPGKSAFAPHIQAGAQDPCVVPAQVPLAESSLYSRASQYRSRHPVEAGAGARGMEASPPR